jgi:hypothetical protein
MHTHFEVGRGTSGLLFSVLSMDDLFKIADDLPAGEYWIDEVSISVGSSFFEGRRSTSYSPHGRFEIYRDGRCSFTPTAPSYL